MSPVQAEVVGGEKDQSVCLLDCVSVPDQTHPGLLQKRRERGEKNSFPPPPPLGPGLLALASGKGEWKVGVYHTHTPLQGGAFMARSSFWQDWLVQVALDGWPRYKVCTDWLAGQETQAGQTGGGPGPA